MSWRKHKSHREETRAVKEALANAGIDARVGHGRGTAWGWLEIRLSGGYHRDVAERALRIAQEVTGRHGEYHGEINVM